MDLIAGVILIEFVQLLVFPCVMKKTNIQTGQHTRLQVRHLSKHIARSALEVEGLMSGQRGNTILGTLTWSFFLADILT